MRRTLLLLVGALLCPTLAGAHEPYSRDDLAADLEEFATAGYWLSIGLGGGSFKSLSPAPSAGRDAFGGSIDAGIRITPSWGIGMELGIVAPTSGCGDRHCTPANPQFAPDFTRLFLLGEYRPSTDRNLRLRIGAGVSGICYRYYRTTQSDLEDFLEFLLALLSDDYEWSPGGGTNRACDSLNALGGSVSVGYQWKLRNAHTSVGLQLRAEAVNFAASAAAGTPRFRHRAVMLQVQFNIN